MAEKTETVSTNEKEFILQCLKSNVRIDGRSSLDMRAVNITFGHKSGTVEVQIGRTRVLASVTGDIVPPFPDRPNEGFLNFYADFSPMASPYFKADRPSDKSIELARVVERGIKESRAIDTEALCILAGQKVWSVRCDMHILDHEGNLTDCANLATLCALLHFRRPDVTVIGETVTIHSVADKQPVPLALHHMPISITFGFFDDGASFLVDPSLKEELSAETELHITMNANKEVCCIQQSGGSGIMPDQLLKCAQIASIKAAELTTLIQQRLKTDSEKIATGKAVNAFVVRPKTAAELAKTKANSAAAGMGAAAAATAGAAAAASTSSSSATAAAAAAADSKRAHAPNAKSKAAASLISADGDSGGDNDSDGDSGDAKMNDASAKPAASTTAAAASKSATAKAVAAAVDTKSSFAAGGKSAWADDDTDDASGEAASERAHRLEEFDAFARNLQAASAAQAASAQLLKKAATTTAPNIKATTAAAVVVDDSDDDSGPAAPSRAAAKKK